MKWYKIFEKGLAPPPPPLLLCLHLNPHLFFHFNNVENLRMNVEIGGEGLPPHTNILECMKLVAYASLTFALSPYFSPSPFLTI